jgi:hypothetical protein
MVIFPMQKVPIIFSHRAHLSPAVGATCRTCHPAAYSSDSASDALVPSGKTCDACHKAEHDHPGESRPDAEPCARCHLGQSLGRSGEGGQVARVEIPRPNIVFSHRVHAVRNIGCAQCHGAVDRLELATRDQLPRMRGCFRCHAMSDAASRGDAKSSCDTCHPTEPGGRIRTILLGDALSSGVAKGCRAHAGLLGAAQARGWRRFRVLRRMPQGSILHRLPRRAR